MLTYSQNKYATLTASQNAIINIDDNIQTEIHNLEITNQQNVSKGFHCHTNHTDFMYQGNNTIHQYDNRRNFIIQNRHSTYQRKSNQEVEIQLLSTTIADLQNQIINLSNSNPPPDGYPGACINLIEPIIIVLMKNMYLLLKTHMLEANICIYPPEPEKTPIPPNIKTAYKTNPV